MASRLNPYIHFRSEATEALEFYRTALGGTVTTQTFREAGMTDAPDADKVMHGQLETPAGFTLMASDTPESMEHRPGRNVDICLSGDDTDDLRTWFANLSEGAEVTAPLEKQMWGDEFGMLVDKFGISWMVNIASGS